LGTPFQEFFVSFDTQSSETWVYSSKCQEAVCEKHESKFYASHSHTYRSIGNFGTPFCDGYVRGGLATDAFRVGGLVLPAGTQNFGEILTSSAIFGGDLEGVAGLPLKPGNTSSFFNLIRKGLIKEEVFGVWLNRPRTAPHGGELTLGGYNSNLFTLPITWAEVVEDGWVVRGGVALGGVVLAPLSKLRIDTGSSDITLPPPMAKKLFTTLGCTFLSDEECLWMDGCPDAKKLPKFGVTIQGRDFTFDASEYLVPTGDTCSTFFDFSDETDYITLGAAFLQKYYSIFDIAGRKIGFAQSI
jgi:hypothetical protein